MKFFLHLIVLIFFTACSTDVIVKDLATINHKNLAGTNDFNSLVEFLVRKQELRVKNIVKNEIVLVSDFVNVDRLKNRSKLGFLLSEHLKNSLINRDIIVREVILGRDFELADSGFNLLTRDKNKITSDEVTNRYAFVGTYSLTTESLIVFIKLIDITTGNILSSTTGSVLVDGEIRELERSSRQPSVITPMVL